MVSLITSVDAHLGTCPRNSFGDDCITAWDGIMYLEDAISLTTASMADFQSR